MTSGRKPKPTAMKLVLGVAQSRMPKKEAVVPPGLPAAPRLLNPDGRLEWDRLVMSLYKAGMITDFDGGALAAYCQSYGRWVEAETALANSRRGTERDPMLGLVLETTAGNLVNNPLLGIANVAMRDMVKFASEFGLTPSSRSKVTALDVPTEEQHGSKASYFG